ncbi:MAG: hypothetical protein WAU00_05255 [Caldilinea sp.]
MAQKEKYARRAQDMASIFSSLADDIMSLRNVYWDRGYNSGGGDPLTDADVEALGVVSADVTDMVTFADALETFLVANRGYLSKMRNDL